MPRIRRLEIANFRGIKELTWHPALGLNCLVGPGDSGKTTILDAIDTCLGARRNIQFTDADFHKLDVSAAIAITITLGDLDDALKNIDTYGLFLRGFDKETCTVEDEPHKKLETVLTLRVSVESDLEPHWTLVSDRAAAQGVTKALSWADRLRLAPTKIGAFAHHNLGWGKGSVLNRVSDERADAPAALAQAARDARAAFGEHTKEQLAETLALVVATAKELGVGVGDEVKAMLDAQSASFTGGTISLHDEAGVPLSALGVGSTRLMVAGLQRKAAATSPIILVDELEHGLEPQRVIRFLDSLGAKEATPPLQVFMSTHSPVAVRELSANQLYITRRAPAGHSVTSVGAVDDVQGTVRLYPDAFLASSVIVCEGASEVGFMRGLDQAMVSTGKRSIAAMGVALVDSGGVNNLCGRAGAFRRLGYRVAILRDNDATPDAAAEAALVAAGVRVNVWRYERALEQELFSSMAEPAIHLLIERAVELHGADAVNDHIKSASQGKVTLDACRSAVTDEHRKVLGLAAKAKKSGWFKSVTWMEDVCRDVVGPHLEQAEQGFRDLVSKVLRWAHE